MNQPRPYQQSVIAQLRVATRTLGNPGILQAPTGAGKSEMFGMMAHSAVSMGKRVGAVVNRRLLVNDLCTRVDKLGLEYGVIMGQDSRRNPLAKIQVASFDTLWRRPRLPKWDLCFIDECHFSLAEKYVTVLNRLVDSGCVVIGMTATPVRGVNQGLGPTYKWMVRCPDTPELIRQGYLTKPIVFGPNSPDLTSVSTVRGEFDLRQLAAACDTKELTGDILKHWLGNGRGRPTIGFGVSIDHCKHMAREFRDAGISADTIDHTYKGNFADFWRKLCNRDGVEVVFNVGMAGYGWDAPAVSHMIEARPTKSPGLWIQHCGRVMRIFPGKKDAIINDHAGNWIRHGMPDDPRDWSLDGEALKPKDPAEKEKRYLTCKVPVTVNGVLQLPCYAIFPPGPKNCPYCGIPIVARERKIEVADGELREVVRLTPEERAAQKAEDLRKYRERRENYFQLVRRGRSMGYKPGWAKVSFQAVHKQWPLKKWDEEVDNPKYADTRGLERELEYA